ncbi:hypothetical protein Tco_0462854 [Tanacetum coccineum]
MRVRLWIQQRHEFTCALRKFQGIGCTMIGGEGDGVSNWTSSGVFGERGALGALGDEFGSLGDGDFMSYWVKSTNNYFGGYGMLIFGLLETLEMEALVEAMNVYGC